MYNVHYVGWHIDYSVVTKTYNLGNAKFFFKFKIGRGWSQSCLCAKKTILTETKLMAKYAKGHSDFKWYGI